jgi:hypothetical protein
VIRPTAAVRRWRNRIVTALIEFHPVIEVPRRALHHRLMPTYSARDEAQIDETLCALVRSGAIAKPRWGWYKLTARKEPRPMTTTTRENVSAPLNAMMDNVLAYRLGEVARKASEPLPEGGGDLIDRGLVLLRLLNEAGFVLGRAPSDIARD